MYYGEGYGYLTPTTNTEIIANDAANDGGGIYCESFSLLTLINCNISDNICINGNGGGIWYGYGGELTLNNCNVSGNTAPAGNNGGGIYAGDVTTPWDTTVIINSNSTISGNTAGYNGGGLFLIKTNLTVNDSTISNNSAFEGAGVWAYNCTANVIDCTVRGNSAAGLGGGFSFINSLAIINNSIMTGNNASSSVGGTGGALFFEGWSDSPHKVGVCQTISAHGFKLPTALFQVMRPSAAGVLVAA
jgi:parallel beta-helix repeat protein